MNLDKTVNIEILADKMVDFTGSDIQGVCSEAGILALWERWEIIT